MASAIDELARKLYVDLPICGKVPNPFHPYGVRGVGETPIVAPLAALSNAVRDQFPHRRPAAVTAEGARGDRRAAGGD